jgi:hypothetical protein
MTERFTEEAIKVVMLAQEEARDWGHNFGTEQILLGLIGELFRRHAAKVTCVTPKGMRARRWRR